eukprot:5398810-Prymnesium_polylepis.1
MQPASGTASRHFVESPGRPTAIDGDRADRPTDRPTGGPWLDGWRRRLPPPRPTSNKHMPKPCITETVPLISARR